MIFVTIQDNDDRLKIEKLYYQHRKIMYYTAYEILRDKELAEDALHDSFIKIIKNLHKIDEINCPRTRSFMVIICRNVAINIYNKRKHLSAADNEVENLPNDENVSPMNIVINKESLERLTGAIMELKPIYRDVLLLRYSHDFSREEIAEQLEITVETVKKRITRAKKILVEKLEKEGIRYE